MLRYVTPIVGLPEGTLAPREGVDWTEEVFLAGPALGTLLCVYPHSVQQQTLPHTWLIHNRLCGAGTHTSPASEAFLCVNLERHSRAHKTE